MDADLKSFGNRLRQLREARGLTQAELARQLPVSEGLISRWERAYQGQGRVWKPDRQTLLRLIKLFCDGLNSADAQVLATLVGYKLTPSEVQALFPAEQIRPGAAASVAPTSPPANRWQNLPLAATSFVGRVQELTQLGELLADPAQRLITILGPGGIGKTRLALAAAAKYAAIFRNGVLFVSLAGMSNVHFLPNAIITTLDAPLPEQPTPQAQLLTYLRDLELLLLLDNYEQFLPDVEFLTQLLRTAPGVTLLVTSRGRLEMQAEYLFELAGLDYPHTPARGSSEIALNDYSASQLFVQRARQVQRNFALTAADAAAILRIGRITEGMPLALELAAAVVRTRSCTEIADALEKGQQLLSTQLRDLPERQRSMQNVFEHSIRFLSADEFRALCALACFRGGFTAEAAESVAGASRQTLAALVDKSLLRVSNTYRYDMHELMRQYAQQALEASSASAQVREQYVAYFMGMAKAAKVGLVGARPGEWIARLEPEIDNLRTVLQWLRHNAAEDALRMAMDLFWLWHSRSYLQEGLEWLTGLSSPDAPVSPYLQADAYRAASFFALCLNRLEEARAWIMKSLTLYRTLDLTEKQNAEGYVYALTRLSFVFLFEGTYEQALAVSHEAHQLARELDSKRFIAIALYGAGEAYCMQERYDQAALIYEESLTLMREVGDLRAISQRLSRLANVTAAQGDDEQASVLCRQMLNGYPDTQDQVSLTMTLLVVVKLAIHQGHFARAGLLLGATETVLESNPIVRTWPQDRRSYNASMATLRAHLAASELEQLLMTGRALSLEQTVALALSDQL